MLTLLATISCLYATCPAQPQLATGQWALKGTVGDYNCQGFLDLAVDATGAVQGTFALCDFVGTVTGTEHSNELVLELVPSKPDQDHVKLRAALAGDHFAGTLDDQPAEGWRGMEPTASPAPRSGGSEDADDDDDDGSPA